MPIYEYRCKQGHNFEVIQSMSDDPVTSCTVCGAPVDRVFHPVAVHFKGSGFYTTDYGRKRGGGGGDSDGSKSDSKETSSSKSESKSESSKSDSKSESKSESKSDSKPGSSGD